MIFPDQPLFMVDRGWQRSKKRAGKNSSQTSYEGELDLQPSRVPEVTITVAKGPAGSKSVSPPDSKKDQAPTRGKPKRSAPVQFMNYEPLKSKRKQQQRSQQHLPKKTPFKAPLLQPEDISQDLFVFKQSLPGTATALYSVIDPEVSSFQTFVSYCKSHSGKCANGANY